MLEIGRAVVYYARMPMHLVQELNAGTVDGSRLCTGSGFQPQIQITLDWSMVFLWIRENQDHSSVISGKEERGKYIRECVRE